MVLIICIRASSQEGGRINLSSFRPSWAVPESPLLRVFGLVGQFCIFFSASLLSVIHCSLVTCVLFEKHSTIACRNKKSTDTMLTDRLNYWFFNWTIPGLFFSLFSSWKQFVKFALNYKKLPMTGFELF